MIGVILAGGESRRFGSQKAFHMLDGKPFYQHIHDTMVKSGCFEAVVINTNEVLASRFSMPVIVDDSQYAGLGPLTGIYSVMNEVPYESYFVISVDTPFITTRAIEHLISHYQGNITVYRDSEQIHATIGIYPVTLKTMIEHQLKTRCLSIRQLFDEQTKYIDVGDIPGHWYANINHPEDLKGV
ncbi:molybdenum cofactor guanylyltransferase [Macrococcus carouselicus]|uniref:Probable molybdenum cofactor guanylyltransferase n=1 Tax=Macrococcus carouselicus TaxID=69969 RepID=A0A9Q8CLB8_9STAP|nr:molybdenum cofactor guanylyltransferase [Macrococcus carouselicus]TDM02315.1 molybdenum cofactor guanylyltransferase [Macrococcus carouselicus]